MDHHSNDVEMRINTPILACILNIVHVKGYTPEI